MEIENETILLTKYYFLLSVEEKTEELICNFLLSKRKNLFMPSNLKILI